MSNQHREELDEGAAASFRIGLSANLSNGDSVHRRTFLRAAEMALEPLSGSNPQVELNYVCDGANAEAAVHAAHEFVAWEADVVVGHYASAAAAAAAEIYRPHGIPLLLPAATADALIEPGGVLFRLCDADRALAQALVRDLERTYAVKTLAIQHDESLHGRALSSNIRAAAEASDMAVGPDEEAVDAVVFAGRFPESVSFLRAHANGGPPRRLVLTDDAVSPELARELPGFDPEVLLYGPRPPTTFPHAENIVVAYQQLYQTIPGIYFLETYAALEIVRQYLDLGPPNRASFREALRQRLWQTVLGPVQFRNNEGGASRYGRWRFARGELGYEETLGGTDLTLMRSR